MGDRTLRNRLGGYTRRMWWGGCLTIISYPLPAIAEDQGHGLSQTEIKMMSIMGAILVMGALSSFWYWLKGRFLLYDVTIMKKGGEVVTIPTRDRQLNESQFTTIRRRLQDYSGRPLAAPFPEEIAYWRSLPEGQQTGATYLLNLRRAIRSGSHGLSKDTAMKQQAESTDRGQINSQLRSLVGDRPFLIVLRDIQPVDCDEYLLFETNGQMITNYRMFIYDPKPPHTISHIIALTDIDSYKSTKASVFAVGSADRMAGGALHTGVPRIKNTSAPTWAVPGFSLSAEAQTIVEKARERGYEIRWRGSALTCYKMEEATSFYYSNDDILERLGNRLR